jgi:hypothetical protein
MRFLSFFEESVILRNVERLRVPLSDDGCLHAVELLMAVRNEPSCYIKTHVLKQAWFDNMRKEGKIQSRVISGEEPTLLVGLSDSIEFIEKIPNIPLDTRNKFIELARRYLAGDDSLVADMPPPSFAGMGEKRKTDVETLERRSKAHEMELTLITKASVGLKEILGGALDAETQRDLKRRCLACVDRFSASV